MTKDVKKLAKKLFDEAIKDSTTKKYVHSFKSDEELKQLAKDINSGKVFGTWACPKDLISNCFIILAFIDPDQLNDMIESGIIHFYEYIDKANPLAVNGYPVFMSGYPLHKEEFEKIVNYLKKLKEVEDNL